MSIQMLTHSEIKHCLQYILWSFIHNTEIWVPASIKTAFEKLTWKKNFCSEQSHRRPNAQDTELTQWLPLVKWSQWLVEKEQTLRKQELTEYFCWKLNPEQTLSYLGIGAIVQTILFCPAFLLCREKK